MLHYLIICRSLTYAQRAARLLERGGIEGHVMRTPKKVSQDGCNYCVRIKERHLTDALKLLQREDMGPKQIYLQNQDGALQEVKSRDLP